MVSRELEFLLRAFGELGRLKSEAETLNQPALAFLLDLARGEIQDEMRNAPGLRVSVLPDRHIAPVRHAADNRQLSAPGHAANQARGER